MQEHHQEAPRRRGVKPGAKRGQLARELCGALLDDDVMLTAAETCRFFGGPTKPISTATLYRNAGTRYPLPVRIGANAVRWLRSECLAARQRMIDQRGMAP
jgi:predicted DNA-binding transcriptional regulator AlpA